MLRTAVASVVLLLQVSAVICYRRYAAQAYAHSI